MYTQNDIHKISKKYGQKTAQLTVVSTLFTALNNYVYTPSAQCVKRYLNYEILFIYNFMHNKINNAFHVVHTVNICNLITMIELCPHSSIVRKFHEIRRDHTNNVVHQ